MLIAAAIAVKVVPALHAPATHRPTSKTHRRWYRLHRADVEQRPPVIQDGRIMESVSSSGSVGGAIFLLVVIVAIVAFAQIYRRRK
jgi:hypothetical protein